MIGRVCVWFLQLTTPRQYFSIHFLSLVCSGFLCVGRYTHSTLIRCLGSVMFCDCCHSWVFMLVSYVDYIFISFWDQWTHSYNFDPLRKHAYSNILRILPPKKRKLSDEKFGYFPYSCSKHRLWVLVRTASHHNLFLSINKKNNVYPCKPQFYCIKVGLRGSKLYRRVFVMQIRMLGLY